jgi:hypothetical protein
MNDPPPSEAAWISVGRLEEGFRTAAGSQCLAPSAGLAGSRIALHFEDGSTVDCHFLSATELIREGRNPEPRGDPASRAEPDRYHATEIRPGIFFVDFIDRTSKAATVSLALDLGRGICTALSGLLPAETDARTPLIDRIAQRELTGVEAVLLSGTIGRLFHAKVERHPQTRELLGKRVEYTYSEAERYEHVYLNERFYTWHCLAGSEQGLADTDRCEYRKVADRLYLFVWREKIVPTLGAVLVDLEQMKTTGKIFGYRGFDFGTVVNFPVGARARVTGTV